MKYAELIGRIPEKLRSRIEAENVYASWIQRGQSLEKLWSDPVVLETLYNQMSSPERITLESIVREIGCEPFDMGKLEKAAGHFLSGAEVKSGLSGLLRKGLVFAFRKMWGEHVYLLPSDGFKLWQHIWYSEDFNAGGLLAVKELEQKIEPLYTVSLDIAGELFHTLVLAAQNEWKMTKNGTLHKKIIQKLSEQIRLQEEGFADLALKYAYSDVYPIRVAVILDLLLRLQLIQLQGEEMALREAELVKWLHLSAAERNSILYNVWKELTLPTHAWLQHAVCLLERYELGEWVSAECLLSWLSSKGLLPDSDDSGELDEHSRELQRQWLDPLTAMGWLEKGVDSNKGVHYYRWRTHPLFSDSTEEEEASFMVQPDFDILVPPDVSQAVSWELACLADLSKLDQVSVYRLTKASIQRALENGRSEEDIIGFLERNAMYELSEHIRIAVGQWTRPFGKTSFTEVMLFRCADENIANTVERLPGASKYVLERLGTKDFIISADGYKPLAEILEKAGFMPGLTNAKSGKVPEGVENNKRYPQLSVPLHMEPLSSGETINMEPAEKGFIYSRVSVAHLEMETRLPDHADLYPDLQDIPVMWLKDYRAYHASTRKEIVERAIQMKTVLQIRKNGTDYRVVPRKMQETRGTWCMTGIGTPAERSQNAGEIKWLADEWQEMKLILPGINDKY